MDVSELGAALGLDPAAGAPPMPPDIPPEVIEPTPAGPDIESFMAAHGMNPRIGGNKDLGLQILNVMSSLGVPSADVAASSAVEEVLDNISMAALELFEKTARDQAKMQDLIRQIRAMQEAVSVATEGPGAETPPEAALPPAPTPDAGMPPPPDLSMAPSPDQPPLDLAAMQAPAAPAPEAPPMETAPAAMPALEAPPPMDPNAMLSDARTKKIVVKPKTWAPPAHMLNAIKSGI